MENTNRLTIFIKFILSSEFIFSLFLLAGYFKSSIKSSMVDVTLILLFISLITAFKKIIDQQFKIPKYWILPIVLYLIIIVFAMISYSFTPSIYYAQDKVIRLLIITSWCFVGPIILFKSEESIRKFLLGFLVISIIMGFISMREYIYSSSGFGFVSALGSNYIALGTASAIGSIIFLTLYINEDQRFYRRLVYCLMSLLLVLPLVVSGGRLPVISYVIAIFCIPLFLIKIKGTVISIDKRFIRFICFILFVFIFGAFYISNGYSDTFMYRMEQLTSNGAEDQFGARTLRFKMAVEMIKDKAIIGHGIGSFPLTYSGYDAEDTPHNIFLEVWSELGVFPLIALVSLMIIAVRNGIYNNSLNNIPFTQSQMAIILISLFLFLTANISGSINGSKFFFAYISILIIIPYIRKKGEQNEN